MAFKGSKDGRVVTLVPPTPADSRYLSISISLRVFLSGYSTFPDPIIPSGCGTLPFSNSGNMWSRNCVQKSTCLQVYRRSSMGRARRPSASSTAPSVWPRLVAPTLDARGFFSVRATKQRVAKRWGKPLVQAVENLTSMPSKLIRDITYQSASLVPTVHSACLLRCQI